MYFIAYQGKYILIARERLYIYELTYETDINSI